MGVDVLALLRAEPDRAAILLDIDGTLAPIVARYALVGAITGRPSETARELVGVDGVAIVGSHGVELAGDAVEWRPRLEEFGATVQWPVEDKGLGLSYHYRTHADPHAARAELELVAERARAAGLLARFGRMVLEVLPPLEANKGTAVRALVAGAGVSRALFARADTPDPHALPAPGEL